MGRVIRPRERPSRLIPKRRRPAGFSFPARRAPAAWAAACLLAAPLALLLLATQPTHAQTSVKLVGNTGQSNNEKVDLRWDQAQAFTTGSNTNGYKLTRVDLEIRRTSGTLDYTVSIHQGSPTGTSPGTLTKPSSLPGSYGFAEFTPSGGGIDLAAGTTYYVVVAATDRTHDDAEDIHWRDSNSDAEDSGAAAGWTIADAGWFRSNISNNWLEAAGGDSRKLAVHGYAKTPATVSGVAISSTPSHDTDDDDTPETYGQDAKIRVQVTFSKAVTVTGTPRLKIKMDPSYGEFWANYESGSGTTVLTFAHTVGGTNISTQGIAVLADSLAQNGGSTIKSGTTDATLTHTGLAHDAGHQVDYRLSPPPPTQPTQPTPPPSRPDTTPPRITGTPSVTGATLTILFDERLRGSPPAEAFEVVVGDGAGVTPTAVEVDRRFSQRKVTLTLARSVPHGAAVKVRYTRPAERRERLRDVSGNLVADFTRTVTNDTPEPPPGSPVASAGADLTVDPGAAVTLDGSGSSDPDGEALTYVWSRVSGAAVTLSGAGTARASFTAPAAPGALAFQLTVTDPGGLSGSDGVTVTVRDLAPSFGSAQVSSLVLAQGEAMDPVVLPAATGGNGDLTYRLTSDPTGLAGLSFDAATRTLSGTPGAEGSWTFTWRADDADDNRADSDAAVLTFRVAVEKDARTAEVKRTVRRTLAAVGRRALSSALDNIGARFAAEVPSGALTLAGETVPLGAGGATGLAVGERPCALGAPGHRGLGDASGQTGFDNGRDGCAAGARSRGVEGGELLHTSAFSLTLGAAEGEPGFDPWAPRWAVWGRGDLGSFAGRPEPGMRYEGELRTGWLGVDARAGAWVAGLALSHGTGEADYSFEDGGVSGRGRLETSLTALYPYGRWTVSDGLELRGVLGAGRGEAVHRLDGGERETSDLSMGMGSLGLRYELPALAGIDLAARGDASLARMETGDGPDYVDGLTADSWRARLGLEASRRIALAEETSLTPFVEAAARRDGGDGLTGTGLEVAGGLRYTAPGVQVEARGRWLAAHSEDGAEERGLSVAARMGPGAHGRGLSLSLRQRWGAGTGGAEALWRDELPQPAATPRGDAASVDARVGYGVGLAPYGLLTPFAETGLSGGDSRRLRLGTRFEARRMHLVAEFAGERVESGAAGPEHALRFDLRLRF